MPRDDNDDAALAIQMAAPLMARTRAYLSGFKWGLQFIASDEDTNKCPPLDHRTFGNSISQWQGGLHDGLIEGFARQDRAAQTEKILSALRHLGNNGRTPL